LDFTSFIPAFGGVSFTVLAFVVSLSIIVFVHEFGHYIVGRWSGIHAEVFSVGLGPVLVSLTDRRGTRWQLALIPFGGYVKFLGDKDAASSADVSALGTMRSDDLRRTMHGAPLWARAATVAAGPVFNFILAAVIFALIALWQGQARDPLTIGELYPLPFEHGLENGDMLLEINDIAVPSIDDGSAFSTFWQGLGNGDTYSYTVKRGDRIIETVGPNLSLARVSQVVPRSASAQARLSEGDVIIAVNETPVIRFSDLKTAVEGSNGATLDLTVWRSGEIISIPLTPKRVDEPMKDGGFRTVWRIGLVGGEFFFEPQLTTIDLFPALRFGVMQTWQIMRGSVEGLYHVIVGSISTCNLSGPIGIAETSGDMARQGGQSFIWFIALMSAAIGMVNLFPIPILDGGHLVFYAYEAVVGRPPAAEFLNILMMAGLTIVLSFMAFAIINDYLC
jgi:regulator of sigma E protease